MKRFLSTLLLTASLAGCGSPWSAPDAGRLGARVVPSPPGAPAGVYEVQKYATGGDGTSGNPWTGWEVALNALGTAYQAELAPGWYKESVPWVLPAGTRVHGPGWGLAHVTTSSTFRGQAIQSVFAVNGSHAADVHVSGFELVNGNTQQSGRGNIGLYQLDGTFFYVDHVRFSAWFAGVVLDQTEISFVEDCDFEESTDFGIGTTVNPATSLTVSNVGTAGAAHYSYFVVAVNTSGGDESGSRHEAFAAGVQTLTGNAALNGTDYNHLSWSAASGADHYEVWRARGGATVGKIGTTSSTTFNDTGLTGDGFAPPLHMRGIWVVNNDNVTAGVSAGFTNANWFRHNTSDGVPGTVHVVDDGGDMHVFAESQFNGGDYAIWGAALEGYAIDGNYYESQSAGAIVLEYRPLDWQNGSGNCNGGSVSHNLISHGSATAMTFVAASNITVSANLCAGGGTCISGLGNSGNAVLIGNTTTGTTLADNPMVGGFYTAQAGTCFNCVDPAAMVDVQGSLALRRAWLTLANGTNNDVDLAGTYPFISSSYYEVTGPTADFTTTSFAGGTDGRVIILHNNTVYNWTISNAAGTGTAANRVLTGSGSDLVLATKATATIVYSTNEARWVVLSHT